MKTRYPSVTFRPWPENEKRLKLASEIGLSVSELMNEAVQKAFDGILKQKEEKIRQSRRLTPA